MKLDNMILTDFAAAIISSPNANGEQTTRATVISVDENDDKIVTIRIDGSNEDTAATTTVKCEEDDRVMVLLKGHKATVIGNISSPVLKKVTANDIVAGAVTADAITTQNIESDNENSWINFHLGTFNFGEKLIWDGSDLTVKGTLTAGAGSKIGPWMISDDQIYKDVIASGNEYKPILHAPNTITGSTKAFAVAVKPNGQDWTYPFSVTYDGSLTSTKGTIGGWNILPTKLTKTFTNSNNSSITIDLNPNYGLDIANNTANDLVRVAYDGIWGINWNAGKTVMEEYFQLTPNTFTMFSNLASGLSQTSINGLGMLTNGDIIAGGYISEGGTSLAQKYMGMEVANGYWGLKPNGSNAVYVRTTQNGLIPYQSGGSGTLGTASWPFSTIYGNTIYGTTIRPWQIEFNPPSAAGHGGYIDFHFNGSTADYTSRIIESSSGTLSIVGALTTSSTINANYNGAMIRATNPTHGNIYAGLHASANGTVGVYTNGYWNGSALAGSGQWLIYRNTTNNTCVESKLYTHNEGYTTLRPVVGTNAGTNAVGVIVSNSASFGIYGRWAGGATAAMSGRTISCPASDIRLKENIKDSTVDALSVINSIKIRQFDWKDKSRGHWDCGMVVDEMEKDIDPKFGIGGGEDEDGNISYKSVDTFYLQGYEVKAIQQLSARVEELERRLNERGN